MASHRALTTTELAELKARLWPKQGDPIPVGRSPVVTRNLWRNDDLEWLKQVGE